MAFHNCSVTARESTWLQEEIKKQISDKSELYAYAGAVGSASETEKYSKKQIGHDFDLVLVPNSNIPLGKFMIETYNIIRQINNKLKKEFDGEKLGVPFPESIVQNLALHEAAQKRKQEKQEKDIYNDLIGQHIIIVESKRSIEENLPSGFPADAGKTLTGSYQKIPEKRFNNPKTTIPYFNGFHKHSGAIITPKAFKKDAAIGAALHGIDQAQKYANTKLVTQKELQKAKKSPEKAQKTWKKAIKELDYQTAQKL